MTLPRRSEQEIPGVLLQEVELLAEPVRRSAEAAARRLARRLRDDPELFDIPHEILCAALLDQLGPRLREAVIPQLLEAAEEHTGRIRSRTMMGQLIGTRRQNVEKKFFTAIGRSPQVPEPQSSPDQAIRHADSGTRIP